MLVGRNPDTGDIFDRKDGHGKQFESLEPFLIARKEHSIRFHDDRNAIQYDQRNNHAADQTTAIIAVPVPFQHGVNLTAPGLYRSAHAPTCPLISYRLCGWLRIQTQLEHHQSRRISPVESPSLYGKYRRQGVELEETAHEKHPYHIRPGA